MRRTWRPARSTYRTASSSAWALRCLPEEQTEEEIEEKVEQPKLRALVWQGDLKSHTLDLPLEHDSLEQQLALLLLQTHM
jgi:hypothetical protein